MTAESAYQPWLNSFGRRKGRKLTPYQNGLMENLFPEVAIDVKNPPIAQRIWLEIGFGGGEHLAEQASRHADVLMIGCEPYIEGVGKLLGEIDERKLSNVRILPDDARLILQALPESSVERVFILFPDPWPKARHKKRRIVSMQTLDMIARVMKQGGELRLATDHEDYAAWMLEHVLAHPAFEWQAQSMADFRTAPEDWVPTRYEEKTRAEGREPVYYRLKRK